MTHKPIRSRAPAAGRATGPAPGPVRRVLQSRAAQSRAVQSRAVQSRAVLSRALAWFVACAAVAVASVSLTACRSGDVDPGDWQVASDDQPVAPSGRRGRGAAPAPPRLDGIYRFEATIAGDTVVRELVIEGDRLTRRIDGHVMGVAQCSFTFGALDAIDVACRDADGVTTQLPLVRAGDGLAHRADTAMVYHRVADLAPPERDERLPTVSGEPTAEE